MWRLLDEIERCPTLVPSLSISEVKQQRAQLQADNDILRRIRTHRNKGIAHVDERHAWPDSHLWQDNIVTVGGAKKLLEDLKSVFNKISAAQDGRIWSLETIGMKDTSQLLEELLAKP